MTVSIVIPAYRAHATIARAVESLLAQTRTDWEGIVVSDDGTDYAPTLRAAGIADERLRFVSTGRVGSGCHRARNVGLAAATGQFVGSLDADDLLAPTYIATLHPLARASGVRRKMTALPSTRRCTMPSRLRGREGLAIYARPVHVPAR